MNRNLFGVWTSGLMVRGRAFPLVARLGLLSLLTAAAGCSGIRPAAIPISSGSAGLAAVQFSWLHSYRTGNGVLVTGRIRAPLARLRSLSGHLDVTASFADLRPDVVTETRWRTAPRRGRRTADFRALIKAGAPGTITSIRVAYREGRRCSG